MKKLSLILSILLAFCLCFTGCTDVAETGKQNVKPAMSYDTLSTENIKLPCDSYFCDGKQYNDIVSQFENAGFTNVTAVAQNSDNDKETRVNGSVIAVSVNDNLIFSKDTLCSSNIEIKIYYVVSQINDSISSTQSSSSAIISSEETVASTLEDNSSEQATINSQSQVALTEETETFSDGQASVESDTNSATVWIPASGKKYHSKSTCSGMKNPTEVSRQEAEELGYEPCKRCYK